MKIWVLVVFLVINPVTYIADINSAKEEAKREFLAQKYEQALSQYLYLINQLKVDNEEVFLNLAHIYFNQARLEPAQKYYERISKSDNPIYQSKALNQLGIIACQQAEYEQGLSLFRFSIEAYRQNYEARYNYELVKKMLDKYPEMRKKKDKEDDNAKGKPQSNGKPKPDESKKSPTPDSNSENADKKTSETSSLQPQKLEALKMNREQAENLLNALRAQEVQYIQQLPRQLRQKNRKRQKRLPDW